MIVIKIVSPKYVESTPKIIFKIHPNVLRKYCQIYRSENCQVFSYFIQFLTKSIKDIKTIEYRDFQFLSVFRILESQITKQEERKRH